MAQAKAVQALSQEAHLELVYDWRAVITAMETAFGSTVGADDPSGIANGPTAVAIYGPDRPVLRDHTVELFDEDLTLLDHVRKSVEESYVLQFGEIPAEDEQPAEEPAGQESTDDQPAQEGEPVAEEQTEQAAA